MTTTREVAEMITALRYAGDTFSGGWNNPRLPEIAEEWVDAGFDTESAQEWFEAGAFDGDRAAELRDAGVSAKQVGKTTRANPESLAYAHSNGDVTTEDVVAAVSGHSERG